MAEYLEFFFLGLLQGVFEWLPISSQGILVLSLVLLLGFKPSEAADISILLHLGTCLAAMIYFRRDIVKILKRSSDEDERMLFFLLVASSATVISGLPTYLFFRGVGSQGEAFLGLLGGALIITGLAQRRGEPRRGISSKAPSLGTGLLLGLLQGLSALPGLSRSGITISALLLHGFEGEEALRISYLSSIPASLFASLGVILLGGSIPLGPHLLTAAMASLISALITIGSLIRISQRVNFSSFCILMGLVSLISFILKFIIIL
ncbi:undecaprenyl-diphosphate phosphatase [Candidatus Bathyarchaeota archaeon]|nr:undecaprenyl-diphosphate phosphatase [Candidatus Bathyarchaeota archaeon]